MAFLYLFCAALPVATAPPQTPEPEPQWFSTPLLLSASICLSPDDVCPVVQFTYPVRPNSPQRAEWKKVQPGSCDPDHGNRCSVSWCKPNWSTFESTPALRFNASLFKLTFLYWQSLGWSRGTFNPIFLFKIFKIKLTFYGWWSVSLNNNSLHTKKCHKGHKVLQGWGTDVLIITRWWVIAMTHTCVFSHFYPWLCTHLH